MAKQSQLDKRLEAIENAVIALGASGLGYQVGKRGPVEVARRGLTSAPRFAGRNPVVASSAVIYALYKAGLLDDIVDATLMEGLSNPTPGTPERYGGVPEEFALLAGVSAPKPKKRKQTKFNKAVSAGMKAVRSSKSYGGKGKINNGKRAFAAVTKVASKVNKGKKVPKGAIYGAIARKVRKYI